MHAPPSIIAFVDYRQFLKAKFAHLKSKRRRFTHAYCAKKIGSTPSYLKNILEGRRRIGLSRIAKIANVFELNGFETQYFTIQVIQELVSDAETKTYFTQSLERLKFNQHHLGAFSQKLSTGNQSFPLSNWLYAALLELIRFPDFLDDDRWIASKLIDGDKLEPAKIREALLDLVQQGMIEKREDRYIIKKPTLSTPEAFDASSFKDYRGIVGKVWDVLGNVNAYKKAHFLNMVVRLSNEQETEVFQALEEFRDKIVEIAKEPKGTDRILLISSSALNLLKHKA